MKTVLGLALTVVTFGVLCVGALAQASEGKPAAPPASATQAVQGSVTVPGGDVFRGYYPERALQYAREGLVQLRCEVKASGALVNCVVLSENPTGWGFGEQSVKMAQQEFRVRLQPMSGKLTSGSTITFPIRWVLGD